MSLYKFIEINVTTEQFWSRRYKLISRANLVITYDNDWVHMADVYMHAGERLPIFGVHNSFTMNLYDPFRRIRNELK